MNETALLEEGLVEVAKGTVTTYEGASIEVLGGAYLSPEGVLRTTTELLRLRARAAEVDELPRVLPVVVCTAGLIGLALGYWLGRRGDD